jgi:hypothetical protein
MKTRLALFACYSNTEGPWTRAKGNELGIQILHMVEGEYIMVEMEIGDLKDTVVFNSPGVFPLPWKRLDKYRVIKKVTDGVAPAPTTVEIVLNV